jgi:hypothetical protein
VDIINAEAPTKRTFKYKIAFACDSQQYLISQEQVLRFSFAPSAFTGRITITLDGGCPIPYAFVWATWDFDAGRPNPAIVELESPRIRLVVRRMNFQGAFLRRIIQADAAESVSVVSSWLHYCSAQGRDGGCIHLPAGTRLSLADCWFYGGDAHRGAFVFMATGVGPQTAGAYLSATRDCYLLDPRNTAQGAIFVCKETPSKIKIRLSVFRDYTPDDLPATPSPRDCSLLVTERADNRTTAAEGHGISLTLLHMKVFRSGTFWNWSFLINSGLFVCTMCIALAWTNTDQRTQPTLTTNQPNQNPTQHDSCNQIPGWASRSFAAAVSSPRPPGQDFPRSRSAGCPAMSSP